MGELQARGDVADREHVRHVRAQPLVHEHPAPLHGNALLLESHAAGTRSAADSDEQDVGFEGLAVLEHDLHSGVALGRRGEPDSERQVDAALAVGALKGLRAGDVFIRHEIGQRLDDGDLRSEGSPDARELDANHPAAKHDHALRDVVEIQGLV